LSDRVRSLRLGDRTTQGGKRSNVIPWTLAAIFLLAALGFGYRAYRVSPGDDSSPEDRRLRELLESAGAGGAKPEDIEKLKQILATAGTGASANDVASSGQVVHDGKGNIIALHQVQLSPQVGGEIIWLAPDFKEGAVYKKGDRLAELDPVIFGAQVKGAEAALKVAETNLQQVETGSTLKDIEAAKAQLKNLSAKLELARIDERNKRLAGIGASRDELEKATVQVLVEEAAAACQKQNLDKLTVSLEEQRAVCRAQVNSAQANLEQARKQLKNCTLLAPTTGMVLTKKAELGGYINPLAAAKDAAGYLCEMADLAKIEADMSVQERDFAKVMPPKDGEYQVCTIMPEAYRTDERFLKLHPNGYDGYVSRVMPMADRQKGAMTVRVRIRVPEAEAGVFLKPDMGVYVTFRSKTTKEVEKD
jgi:multidrug efflux pump subunit AcrA (membrane-fusion protein)